MPAALRLIALGDAALEPVLWLQHAFPEVLTFGACSTECWRLQVIETGQLNAEEVLEQIDGSSPSARILAVTDHDLYVPGLNFVFGLAQPRQQRAVIALARLHESFYSRPEDESVFHTRVLKEAVHELGHTYGLAHCERRRCVMHFSNTLGDTDFKRAEFCRACAAKLT